MLDYFSSNILHKDVKLSIPFIHSKSKSFGRSFQCQQFSHMGMFLRTEEFSIFFSLETWQAVF